MTEFKTRTGVGYMYSVLVITHRCVLYMYLLLHYS
jgi:hypothetical protein